MFGFFSWGGGGEVLIFKGVFFDFYLYVVVVVYICINIKINCFKWVMYWIDSLYERIFKWFLRVCKSFFGENYLFLDECVLRYWDVIVMVVIVNTLIG